MGGKYKQMSDGPTQNLRLNFVQNLVPRLFVLFLTFPMLKQYSPNSGAFLQRRKKKFNKNFQQHLQ